MSFDVTGPLYLAVDDSLRHQPDPAPIQVLASMTAALTGSRMAA